MEVLKVKRNGDAGKVADSDMCTGCGACVEACPVQAIELMEDEEGFPCPSIIREKCIDCGMCRRVCPVNHRPETHPVQVAYAAQINDQNALKESTSGGLFTAFAREIFRRSGVVYGCVWDENYNAVIKKAENEDELKPMRGSKYVWSWAGEAFPEVESYLKAGRTVLFSGMPCQIAGLKNYLKKEYDNLFLVAFFCGGAPSPYAFHRYLETITKKVSYSELDLKFRDKEKKGVGVHISYRTKRGKIHQSYVRNPYFFAYHTKVFHRLSCYQCLYRYKERVEDITIGDYWGIEKYHKEMNVKAGVSALLVNTEKGEKLLESVKEYLTLTETKAENIAAGNNLTLSEEKVSFHVPKYRDAFFSKLKKQGWSAAERKYLFNRQRIKLWIKTKVPKSIASLILKRFR